MACAAGLLLLASVTGIHAYHFLRERQQQACGLGHYGSRDGSPQQLVVTHMTPGVADWNIAVPMPPSCKNAQVTGVDTTVCDVDVSPDVTMNDMVSARVHRKGPLHGYATVNVTVYCILLPSLEAYTTLAPDRGDTRSTDDVLSNELISNEVMSNEMKSNEPLANGLMSDELIPNVVKPISSIVIPIQNEVITPQIDISSNSQEVATTSPNKSRDSYQVTIEITPPSYEAQKNQKVQAYKVTLPPHDPKYEVPSRNQMVQPQNPGVPPYDDGASPTHAKVPPQYAGPPPQYPAPPSQHPGVLPQYKGAPPQYLNMQSQHIRVPHQANMQPYFEQHQAMVLPLKYTGRLPKHRGMRPKHKRRPSHYQNVLASHRQSSMQYAAGPHEYTAAPTEYAAEMPSMYNMISPPYVVTTVFRPLGLQTPPVRFVSRHKPFLVFRHF